MRRRPRWQDWAYFAGAAGLIVVAIWRLALPVSYPPGDIRGEVWFNPLTSGVAVLLAGILLVAGVMRQRGGGDD